VTENSDFVARYLRSDDDDRPEHLAAPPVGDEPADDQSVKAVEPETLKPAEHQPPGMLATTGGHEAGVTNPGHLDGDAGSHASFEGWLSEADTGPQLQIGGEPPAGPRSAPSESPRVPASEQPSQISFKQRFDESTAPPLPRGWARVDPAERWAPRAVPGTADSPAGRHIQLDEVVKQRREPAEMGWRKAVYLSTGHLLNLGAGPAERRLLGWKARIVANIPGNYQITAISVKGGVGKTRVTAGVGSVFAELRKQPVIAIDANPTYGGLGRLIDPRIQTSVRDFLAAEDLIDYPRARYYTGQNKQGLEVLAGNQNVANPMALEARTFTDALSRARRFYQLALIDCGAEIEHPVIPAVLSASDALMIVGSCSVEGGLAVETTIDWLAARNGHELLKRSVVVLNDCYRSANKDFIDHVRQTLGRRVHSVKTIPWDAHLRDAVTLDFPALRRRTQLALMELAAELAGGFPTAGALAG
jgi:MinD-like ATPase involved in chromosome partitioning or flagellar assembly